MRQQNYPLYKKQNMWNTKKKSGCESYKRKTENSLIIVEIALDEDSDQN